MADETADNPHCKDPGHADIVSVLARVLGERDEARAEARAEARKAQKRLDSMTSDPAADALRAWPVGSPQWKVIRQATRWRLARGDRSMSGGEFVRICRALAEAVDGLPDAVDWPSGSSRPDGASETCADTCPRYAAGWRDAVATLRDDDRYEHWWSAGEHPSTDRYWDPTPRGHLADYLETVGPDGPEVGGA